MRTGSAIPLAIMVIAGFVLAMPETRGQNSVPMLINYQGELKAVDGSPLPDGSYDMVFRIYETAGSATPLWEERHYAMDGHPVQLKDGILSVLLGSAVGDKLSAGLFDLPEAWLQIRVAGEVMSPRQRIASVAYSIRAEDARLFQGHSPSHFAPADHTHYGQSWTTTGTCLTLTGTDRGLSSTAEGNTSELFRVEGISGYAENAGEGAAFGGAFSTGKSGTGVHYGVWSYADANGASEACGIVGRAQNEGTGEACGGSFSTDTTGSGTHYGIKTFAQADSSSDACGVYSYGQNAGDGRAFGGCFETDAAGSGWHYGLYAKAVATAPMPASGTHSRAVHNGEGDAYGLMADAEAKGSGDAYGGYFQSYSSGSGQHFGLYARGSGNSDASTCGVYASAGNEGSGPADAGYFLVETAGTGQHCGVTGISQGEAEKPVIGVRGRATNTGSGSAYGGYFEVTDSGEGNKYAVYATAPANSQSYAGAFVGNVVIDGDLEVTGEKNAVVQTNSGERRKLYCMESAEMWLEDFGTGSLDNGVAVVPIEPIFSQTVNTGVPYHVFLTPEGDCNGLYVTAKTASSFEVRELRDGTASIAFSYRIVARRKGYEEVRLEKAKPLADDEPPQLVYVGHAGE